MTSSIAVEATHERAGELRSLLHGELVATEGAERDAADCVVLVHEPPLFDALARLDHLCAPEGAPCAPVVVVSVHGGAGLRREALRAGAMEVVALDGLTHAILSAAVEDAIVRFSLVGRARREPAMHADAALRRSEARWNAALESFAEGAIIATEDEEVVYWNPAARAMHGFTRADEGIEPLERTPITFELWTPDGAHKLLLDEWPMRRIQRGEPVRDVELRVRRPDQGWEKVFSYSGAMVDTSAGERLIFLTCRDLTGLRRAEQGLREREHLLRAIIDSTPDLIFAKDRDGRMLAANAATLRVIGRPAEEVLGRAETEYLGDPAQAAVIMENDRRVMERGVADTVEEVVTTPGGETRTFVSYKSPLRDARGRVDGVVGVTRDVTDQRRAEEALRAQKHLYQTVTDNATSALFIMDSRQQCVFMNPAAVHLTGFGFEDVQGRPLHDVIHHTRPDGTPYPLEECPIDRALPTKARERGEDVFVHADGRFYPVAFTASPILEGGRPVGTVIEVRDTTEEKEVERRLRLALAARDEFLSVASHELRTPLTALSLQLERLQKLLAKMVVDGDRPKAQRTLDVAVRQAARLEALIEDLLDVTRIAAGRMKLELRTFELRDLVRDVAERLSEMAARVHCELRLQLEDAATGTWDPDRLDEVLTNLLGNAMKYGAGKPIDVALVADEASVTVRVRDHGIGIDPDAVTRIFGRFERAVPTSHYGGLGLGLFISRHIVEAHGGAISVESAPGQGSTFAVRLPRVAAPRPGLVAERENAR